MNIRAILLLFLCLGLGIMIITNFVSINYVISVSLMSNFSGNKEVAIAPHTYISVTISDSDVKNVKFISEESTLSKYLQSISLVSITTMLLLTFTSKFKERLRRSTNLVFSALIFAVIAFMLTLPLPVQVLDQDFKMLVITNCYSNISGIVYTLSVVLLAADLLILCSRTDLTEVAVGIDDLDEITFKIEEEELTEEVEKS
ncbi:MAG: hypothetical protein B6V02_00130 [Thermoprotei archaeon ex4572_64]|nr:MAG: hypothetical protein B6V02_00130 [Thermoprotei archaeon ex4572_64]